MKGLYKFDFPVRSLIYSCKYSSTGMKLIYIIQVYRSMFVIQNGVYGNNSQYTSKQKYSDTLRPMCENYFKCSLTCLCFTKGNEINMCYLDVQKRSYHKKWSKQYKHFVNRVRKNFGLHYRLCLEIVGNFFSV